MKVELNELVDMTNFSYRVEYTNLPTPDGFVEKDYLYIVNENPDIKSSGMEIVMFLTNKDSDIELALLTSGIAVLLDGNKQVLV